MYLMRLKWSKESDKPHSRPGWGPSGSARKRMNGEARFEYKDILFIFAVWLILIGTMRVLQWLGLDFGFI